MNVFCPGHARTVLEDYFEGKNRMKKAPLDLPFSARACRLLYLPVAVRTSSPVHLSGGPGRHGSGASRNLTLPARLIYFILLIRIGLMIP